MHTHTHTHTNKNAHYDIKKKEKDTESCRGVIDIIIIDAIGIEQDLICLV